MKIWHEYVYEMGIKKPYCKTTYTINDKDELSSITTWREDLLDNDEDIEVQKNLNWLKELQDEIKESQSGYTNWDRRFLDLAQYISGWSKDPSTKVGAVIWRGKNHFVQLGYNGFPANIDDSPEKLNNRDTKIANTVHAEMNAILFAKQDLFGCSIAIWPFGPCSSCASMIIQTGIKSVVFPKITGAAAERWGKSIEVGKDMFKEAGVEVIEVG